MLGVLEACQNITANNIEEGKRIFFNNLNGRNSVILFNKDEHTVNTMTTELTNEIRKRNQAIQNIDDQILVCTPYLWVETYQGEEMFCAEVSGGLFSEEAGKIALFSEFDYSVLSEPESRKPYSREAMASLAYLGSAFLLKNKNQDV